MSNDQSYTVEESCEAERITRGMIYKVWAQGKGPRYYMVGNRRRISPEAHKEWRAAREAETGGAR